MNCRTGVIDSTECVMPSSETALELFDKAVKDTCVNGNNIKQLTGTNTEACAQACLDWGSDCVGIEYYYETDKCNLSSSANTANCDGKRWKTNWYKRKTRREDVSLLELGDSSVSVLED